MKQFVRMVAVAGMLFGFAASSQVFAVGNPLIGMFGTGFIDLNEDSINDNAPDADGDGIPNAQDSDYVRPQDGSGNRYGAATPLGTGTGTGICDGSGPKGNQKRTR